MTDDTQPQKSNMPEESGYAASRLEALESRLAFQEDWLEALDRRLREQDGQIERLSRLNALMRERLREQGQALAELGGETPQFSEEPPPHY